MKKLIIALLIVSFSLNANSQDIQEIVTKEVCSCAQSKKESLKDAKPDTIKMQLGFCILASYTNHKKELVDSYGDVMEKDGAMEKLGEDIGMKMVTICPDVLITFAAIGDTDEENLSGKSVENKSIEGEIVDIKTDQFVTIQVKDKNARIHNFLLLDYFETASLYTNNELKKKDKIKVDYTEYEMYDAKEKEFRYFKVITQLEKK